MQTKFKPSSIEKVKDILLQSFVKDWIGIQCRDRDSPEQKQQQERIPAGIGSAYEKQDSAKQAGHV